MLDSAVIILNIIHKPPIWELSFQSVLVKLLFWALHYSKVNSWIARLQSVFQSCNAIYKLETLSSHDALILLWSSFSIPKVQHFLRCSPCGNHVALATFDALLRAGISHILNSNISDIQWLQASLPVSNGGLRIRRVASRAIPADMASAARTRLLQLRHNPEYKFCWRRSLSDKLDSIFRTAMSRKTPDLRS